MGGNEKAESRESYFLWHRIVNGAYIVVGARYIDHVFCIQYMRQNAQS